MTSLRQLPICFACAPHAKELLWYNAAEGIWNEAQGGNGSTLLRHYVTIMLQRLLTTYSTRKARRFQLENVASISATRRFAKALRPASAPI